jgi:hypothetical protein
MYAGEKETKGRKHRSVLRVNNDGDKSKDHE